MPSKHALQKSHRTALTIVISIAVAVALIVLATQGRFESDDPDVSNSSGSQGTGEPPTGEDVGLVVTSSPTPTPKVEDVDISSSTPQNFVDSVPTSLPSSQPNPGLSSSSSIPTRSPMYEAQTMPPSGKPTVTTQPRWETITSDDFESGFGSFSPPLANRPDVFRHTNVTFAHSGSAAIEMRDRSSTSVLEHTEKYNVTSFYELRVRFWFYALSMERGEGFALEYSSNGGSNWTGLKSWSRGTNFENEAFYEEIVTVSPSTFIHFTDDAKIRFRCAASGNMDHVYIDDVDFEGIKPLPYRPGHLNVKHKGLLLSQGLSAKIVAESGRRVRYADHTKSKDSFHFMPDMGGTFKITYDASENKGGWVYVSNSEMVEEGAGGVGAITFNKWGDAIDYRMVLMNTTMNCAGGKTPWNTWISCEENRKDGQVWEVDPFGVKQARMTVLGGDGGNFESFAYDIRSQTEPHFFVTEDKTNGALRRFTPDKPNWTDPSQMLHGAGLLEYLVMVPTPPFNKSGTYKWTSDIMAARSSALAYYQNTEGIDVHENEMFVISKSQKEMIIFDLDGDTYKTKSTVRGLFDGQPDQVQRIVSAEDSLLYFTEEGGVDAGVHARDSSGRFFTILESPKYIDETTGLDFSPDWKHLYIAYQKNSLLFDVTRDDGGSFKGLPLNVKFHADTTNIV